MVDFYERLFLKRNVEDVPQTKEGQFRQVWVSRMLTIAVGATGIFLACYVKHLGTLFDVMSKVLSTFMAIMLAIFWLGMFTQRATSTSTICGAMAGGAVALFLAFYEPLALGVLWVAPAGLVVALFTGVLLGSGQPSEAARRWNWFAIMQTKLNE